MDAHGICGYCFNGRVFTVSATSNLTANINVAGSITDVVSAISNLLTNINLASVDSCVVSNQAQLNSGIVLLGSSVSNVTATSNLTASIKVSASISLIIVFPINSFIFSGGMPVPGLFTSISSMRT